MTIAQPRRKHTEVRSRESWNNRMIQALLDGQPGVIPRLMDMGFRFDDRMDFVTLFDEEGHQSPSGTRRSLWIWSHGGLHPQDVLGWWEQIKIMLPTLSSREQARMLHDLIHEAWQACLENPMALPTFQVSFEQSRHWFDPQKEWNIHHAGLMLLDDLIEHGDRGGHVLDLTRDDDIWSEVQSAPSWSIHIQDVYEKSIKRVYPKLFKNALSVFKTPLEKILVNQQSALSFVWDHWVRERLLPMDQNMEELFHRRSQMLVDVLTHSSSLEPVMVSHLRTHLPVISQQPHQDVQQVAHHAEQALLRHTMRQSVLATPFKSNKSRI